MKKKIFIALGLVGFLGICFATTISAKSIGQSQEHRVYPEFKQLKAKNVKIAKKVTLKGEHIGAKVKPDKPGKPDKPEKTDGEATGVLGTLLPADGVRYAIVIGIANYPGTVYDLNYTDDDAYDMKSALMKNGFAEADIKMLVDVKNADNPDTAKATATKIYEAIMDLKTKTNKNGNLMLTANDEVFFFFSGHGGYGEVDDGAVVEGIPTNDGEIIDESIISHDWILNKTTEEFEHKLVPIWDGQLKSWFSNFPTNRIIFAFDSCRAGGMNDVEAEGRIVNMATTETGAAYEFYDLQNGQFSHYFVDKALLQGEGDVTGTEGIVTVEEAFDYAKKNYRKQDKRRGPTISDMFGDDLAL